MSKKIQCYSVTGIGIIIGEAAGEYELKNPALLGYNQMTNQYSLMDFAGNFCKEILKISPEMVIMEFEGDKDLEKMYQDKLNADRSKKYGITLVSANIKIQ